MVPLGFVANPEKPLRRCCPWEALLRGGVCRPPVLPPRLLGTLEDPPPSPEPEDRLVRVATPITPETPRRFLARAPEAPRWFWQHGEAWVAGIGQAWSIHIPPGPDTDRFTVVKEKARALAEDLLHADDATPPLTFIGGFAFHQTPQRDPSWDPFGAACFAIPALSLRRTKNETQLVGTARIPHDADPAKALDEAHDALKVAAKRLQEPPPTPTEYQIPRTLDELPRADWEDAVEQALQGIQASRFDKVVLARTIDLSTPGNPDPATTLANLRQGNPGTNLFLTQPTPQHAFLGAAPELVCHVNGSHLRANAVAGSIPRGADEDEDDRLARTLASSTKDRQEHGIVVDAMRRRLAPFAEKVEVARDTNILRLANIQHLERDLYARIPPTTHVLDILEELHPTPAVCGHPRDAARAFLEANEPFARGWYAGPVGWFDVNGDGAFAPGLRSVLFTPDRWRLFAGAGIVQDSQPRDEWDETRTKFQTILQALGHPIHQDVKP